MGGPPWQRYCSRRGYRAGSGATIGLAARSVAMPRTRISTWIERVLLVDGGRCRRADEAHQRPGGISLLRPGLKAGGEHGDQLDVGGQRTDIVDAGKEGELADLLEADIGLSIGYDAADENACRRLLELALDLVGNAQLLEHGDDVDAARAGGIADRLGGEQRLLERIDRADVGLRLALADRQAHAGFSNIGAAAGDHLAALRELVDRLAGHDQKVVAFTVGEPLHHAERAGEDGRVLVPRRFLELRHQLLVGLLGGLRGQNLDLGGVHHAREQEHSAGDRQSGLHAESSLISFVLLGQVYAARGGRDRWFQGMNDQVRPKKLIRGATGDWEVIIGLEVHAQVTSHAKLFSGASTEFGGEPNSHVSLVDAAMPGMLPVINEECVKQAVRTGLGLKAKINLKSVFDRKNYFYPDLPQGYQISQYKSPVVGEGEVTVDLPDGEAIKVGIERLHLEQDAGKSLHDQHPTMSYVDLNRAGVALMEIVSKPDLRSAEEAKAYVTKLRSILRYLGTCDGDMEQGNLRADVNVSVRRPGEPLGTRCEIKNVNSIRFIGQAIEHEARRQIEILEDGATIEHETRLFDPDKGETRSMRSKEEAHDYRYFPDPDLLPLELSGDFVSELAAHLPELPDAKKARFMREHALSAYDANVLVSERETAAFFEDVARGRDAKTAANWVINELAGRLNKEGKDISASPLSAAQLGAILDLIAAGTISGKIAKDLFEIVWSEGGAPAAIVKARGMEQVTDLSAIEKVVDDIVGKNADKVAQARSNPKLIGWFIGQVMKASGGKANPQAVNDLLKRKLGI